jgi:iron complex outermembrane receptor protein
MTLVFHRARASACQLAVISASMLLVSFCLGSQAQEVPTLKETVVTATRFEESAQTLSQVVSTITREEIQRSGVQSVPEALMKLLGVVGKVDTGGGGNYAVDLRGFGETASNNQVVIVDGRRLNEGDLTKADLASIAIDSVQSIEILRGSAAVLYGEGATAGAIVVTTRAGRGDHKTNGASISYGSGSFGLRDTRVTANFGGNGLDIDIAAQDRSSDGFRRNFASKQNAVAATVQWSNDWMRAGVQANSAQSRSGLPGPLTISEYNEDASQTGQAGSISDWAQTNNDNMGLFWQGYTEEWELGTEWTQRKRKLDSVNGGATAYTVDGNALNVRGKRRYSSTLGKGSIAIGLESYDWVRQTSMAYGAVETSRSKTDNQAWYALAQWQVPTFATALDAGFRQERVQKTKSTYSGVTDDTPQAWHIGLSQPVNPYWRLFGRVGSSYRLGNIDEVFPFGVSSVANLATQISRDTEIGAGWKQGAGALGLRWYRHSVRNEIAYDGSNNVNLDPTEHRGIELEGRAQLTSALSVRANLASRQNVFTDGSSSGKETYLTPRQTAAVSGEYRWNAHHALTTGLTSVSSQYVDQANTCSVPAYTTLDARYAYQRDRLEFSLAVNNLANLKYYTYAYGCTSGIYPEAGRTMQLNAKYRF